MREMWLLCLAALAAGCGPEPKLDEDDDDTGFVPGGGSGEDAPFDLEVLWGANTVELKISGGADGTWYFGMAETGAEGEGWLGEDCVGGAADEGYAYCHPASTVGVVLEYGGDKEDLREGEETVFPDEFVSYFITYFVQNTETGECWVWGEDVAYYRDYDCTVWTPGGDTGETVE